MQATAQNNHVGQQYRVCGLDRALADIAAGRIHSWSSTEEMFQVLGI